MLRQLTFALFDFRIHFEYKDDGKSHVYEILNDVVSKYQVTPRYDNSRFPNSFNHIFAGGYAAGYYSYKWAEVLAADAFSNFEEDGISTRRQDLPLGIILWPRAVLKILMVSFTAFRGRKPKVDALLIKSGINYK